MTDNSHNIDEAKIFTNQEYFDEIVLQQSQFLMLNDDEFLFLLSDGHESFIIHQLECLLRVIRSKYESENDIIDSSEEVKISTLKKFVFYVFIRLCLLFHRCDQPILSLNSMMDFLVLFWRIRYVKSSESCPNEKLTNLIFPVLSLVGKTDVFLEAYRTRIANIATKLCTIQRKFQKSKSDGKLSGFELVSNVLDDIKSLVAMISIYTNLSMELDEEFWEALRDFYEYFLPLFFEKLISSNKDNLLLYSKFWNSQIQIKLLFLCLLDSYVHGRFYDIDPMSNIESNYADMLAFFKFFVHSNDEITDEYSCFKDAPILVDYELAYGLTKKLNKLPNELLESPDVKHVKDTVHSQLFKSNNSDLENYLSLVGENVDLLGLEKPSQDASIETENLGDKNAFGSQTDELELLTLITQVQDVFPDFGEGFIEACLKEYGRDPEMCIAALCEPDSLPESLKALDKATKRLSHKSNYLTSSKVSDIEVSNQHKVLEKLPRIGQSLDLKQKIMDLAYNDEYDDTFDDSEAFITQSKPEDIKPKTEEFDSKKTESEAEIQMNKLVHTYMKDPKLFARDPETRRSKQRKALKYATKLTDEQIEGWFLMFNRNVSFYQFLNKIDFHFETAKEAASFGQVWVPGLPKSSLSSQR